MEYGGVNSGECSIEGCHTKAHSKGICMKHYTRQRSGKIYPTECTKANCNKKFYAKGLCEGHYMHQRKINIIWRG